MVSEKHLRTSQNTVSNNMTSDRFWDWAKIERDGEIFETDWVICKDGTLINSVGNWASNKNKRSTYIRNNIQYKGKFYKMTRNRLVALSFVPNPRPDLFKLVDHIDRDTSNDHYKNLRWVNPELNALNTVSTSIKPQKNNKYPAAVTFRKKERFLGYYDTEQQAIKICNYVRNLCFETLYRYYTTKNNWASPDEWKICKDCVYVRH